MDSFQRLAVIKLTFCIELLMCELISIVILFHILNVIRTLFLSVVLNQLIHSVNVNDQRMINYIITALVNYLLGIFS